MEKYIKSVFKYKKLIIGYKREELEKIRRRNQREIYKQDSRIYNNIKKKWDVYLFIIVLTFSLIDKKLNLIKYIQKFQK